MFANNSSIFSVVNDTQKYAMNKDLETISNKPKENDTAWKMAKYGVFSGQYFPVFGRNTKIYGV